ncbi:hypothetical protein [Actinophytocola glycyrrhizae]|uniref:Uncharacterized protein n=1 Tax=Actinophytocola glycyrrhizae TaxID=2044873 RepID=A0ABV9S2Y9_9PSEU
MAIDVSMISKLTDAVEALKSFVSKVAGADEKEQAAPRGAVPENSAAVRMARNARQSYQKTARWMLAAFAAVGALIFGSLPFAAVADVEVRWPSSLWLIGGLVLAVAGIVSAVVAVSMVSEPEDASLGELDSDLRSIQKTDDKGFVFVKGKPVITVSKLRAWWNPRIACRIELAHILHGPESSAHLGPNLHSEDRQASIANLIQRLGQLESEHAKLAPVVANLTVSVSSYEKRIEDLGKLLVELRARRGEDSSVDKEIGTTSAMYTAAATKLDSERAALTTRQKELAEIDDQLTMYQDHRSLVLAESGVMQLRGRFRLARRVLAIAAVLTLFGGTGYALALPSATAAGNEKPAAPAPSPAPERDPAYTAGLPANVTIHAGTSAAAELPRECVGRELTAVWVGDTRVPPTVGPFTALITDAACVGAVRVGRGEGTFSLVR